MSLALPAPAQADEPFLLHLDGAIAFPVGEPQSDWFSPGIAGGVGFSRSLIGGLAVGARLRGGVLFNGPAPSDTTLADPGHGPFSSLSAVVRVRPLAFGEHEPPRSPGLFIDAAGGVALTGSDARGSFEIGAGWLFDRGHLSWGPVARWMQIVERDNLLDASDARILMLGAEVVLLDHHPEDEVIEEPSDRDGDGIPDHDDVCPDAAEDEDGYQDEDGCPDFDNDGDEILDVDDECMFEPEDLDGWDDDDGCPDTDNDGDGFLDGDDMCPNEAEVINGIDDQDGCPDEGLIEFVRDRIVLEETVLFATERARVRSRARPVIAAIVELWRQHPEWTRVRIEGHADQRGNDEFNMQLSQRRAERVRDALIREGMPGEIIEAEGFGSTRPRDLTNTDRGHERNRRVEFVVVSTGSRPVSAVAAPEEGDGAMDFEGDEAAESETEPSE